MAEAVDTKLARPIAVAGPWYALTMRLKGQLKVRLFIGCMVLPVFELHVESTASDSRYFIVFDMLHLSSFTSFFWHYFQVEYLSVKLVLL